MSAKKVPLFPSDAKSVMFGGNRRGKTNAAARAIAAIKASCPRARVVYFNPSKVHGFK